MSKKITKIPFPYYILILIKLLYYIYTKKNKYDNITITKKISYFIEDFCFWLIEFFVKFDMVFDVQTTKSINIVKIFEKILEQKDLSKLISFKQTLEYNHLRFKTVDTVIFILDNEEIIINVDNLYNEIRKCINILILSQTFDTFLEGEDDYIRLYFSNIIKFD